jgi:TPR repeat protein
MQFVPRSLDRSIRGIARLVWFLVAGSMPRAFAEEPFLLPQVIHECDSNCNTLTLQNGNYVVPPQPWERPPGPVIWRVESFTKNLVALHRKFPVDQIFRGRISEEGTSLVDVTLDGRPANIQFSWGKDLERVPGSNVERDRRSRGVAAASVAAAGRVEVASLPQVIHECDSNCNTLTLQNGNYVVPPQPWEHPPGPVIWRVESFTKDLVALHRSFPVDQTFRGRISEQGTSLVDVTIDGRPENIRFSWGKDLARVPGSNAERDRASTVEAVAATNPEAAQIEAQMKPADRQALRPDLSGDWVDSSTVGSDPLKVTIYQQRNFFVAVRRSGDAYVPIGQAYFEGDPAAGLIRLHYVEMPMNGKMQWVGAKFSVTSPDTLEVQGQLKMHRVARREMRELPCNDRGVTEGVSGEEAHFRGYIYNELQMPAPALCWEHVGALRGNADAQAIYGAHFLLGKGSPQDIPQALPWLQRAAMQGEYSSAINLALMFEKGAGVPASAQRAAYWRKRAAAESPDDFHNDHVNPYPFYALQTSGPCDAARDAVVEAQAAYVHGFVAYQARDLVTAACWFRIAAAQGHLKSKTYVALFSLFGFGGLERDLKRAFTVMSDAAAAGDSFARSYLADFYLYGIGTPKKEGGFDEIRRVVNQTAEGQDAWIITHGGHATLDDMLRIGMAMMTGLQSQKCDVDGKNCNDPSAESFAQLGDAGRQQADARASRNQLLHPEEIYPEHFSFNR